MLPTILFYIFICAIAFQLLYYIFVFGKFNSSRQVPISSGTIPVSVIVAAKNEADNLKKLIPALMAQNYSDFELVLVNDASVDNTLEIMSEFSALHPQIKIVNIKEPNGGKKRALSKGIGLASKEYLLFTDADCLPLSKYWIQEMSDRFNLHKSIVLGYGAYEKIQSSFLNKLIRYETLLTATQFFSYASLGWPYMGVGRNLAYKKRLFTQNGGYQKHLQIRSGDDDLFINEVANKANTAICLSENSFTYSMPEKNIFDWFRQKRRHLTTVVKYKPFHQFMLGLFFISQFVFWSLAIILLLIPFNWQLVLLLIAGRLLVHGFVLKKSANVLNEKDLILFFPILDLVLVSFQVVIFFSNIIEKPKTW